VLLEVRVPLFPRTSQTYLLPTILLLLVSACFAQRTVTLSATNGPPTTKLLVSGSGFDPYSAVDIFFDRKDRALAVTDGNGSFGQTQVVVPGSATPGGHWITAVERYNKLAARNRFLVETNWAQIQFSPDLNGFNPYENVLNRETVAGLTHEWTGGIGSSSYLASMPTMADGLVYAGFGAGLSALSARDGSQFWFYPVDEFVTCTPAVADGMVFFSSENAFLYALNAKSGAFVWKRKIAEFVTPLSPTVVNNTVFVGAYDSSGNAGYIYALDASTGTPLWNYTRASRAFSPPAVVNGVVFAGFLDEVVALNAATGSVLWEQTQTQNGEPSFANGVLYVSGYNGVYALSASTGDVLWQFGSNAEIYAEPSVANGAVYVASFVNNVYEGYVHALDASTGSELWKYDSGSMTFLPFPAVVANGVVYAGVQSNSSGGYIYALDASNGTVLWSGDTGSDGGVSGPIVTNGTVIVQGFRGVYAFDLSSGKAHSNLSPPDPQTLVPDLQLKISRPN